MKNDTLQQLLSARTALEGERDRIIGRLREIEVALGAPTASPSGAPRGKRMNPMPLRDAVIQVTANGALTKQEIHDAVVRLGYKFKGRDPLNALGVVIYGRNPKFRNENGRFSPAAGASAQVKRGKRRMSAEGRARIAAAARKRWAAHRKKRRVAT